MKKSHLLILLSLMLSGFSVLAAETSLPTVMNTLQSTSVAVNSQLTTMALRTLGAALLLQWILTNWKELFSGEITSLFQKIAGLVTWAGICFWAMGNQDILSTMFTGYLNMASNVTGIKFTPENVWANGVDLQNNMVIAFNNRTGAADSLYSSLKNLLPSLLLMLACLLILVSYGVIAISILVAVSEFWLMFTVTPIAIALLGLQAFRDQGMAPLKGVISLGMRLIILGVIVKILASVQAEVVNAFENMPQVNPLEIVWYALGGVFACAVMAFNAGKIASAIASGSSNFSGSDAIRGGLQMVSTAAAVGTMGATAASAAMSASSNPAGMGNGPIGGGMQSLLGGASGSGGGGNLGVSSGAGSGAGAGAGPAKVGGAIPSDPNGASAAKFDSASNASGGGGSQPGGSNIGAGDASSAGIGGGSGDGNTSEENSDRKPSFSDGMGKIMDKLGQQTTGDNHAVNISMNTRGDG